MRHGIAVESTSWDGPDRSRPLTSEGRNKTKAIAKALKKNHGLSVDTIWTSPLTRAMETAEIVGEVLKAPVQQCALLAEGIELEELAAEVNADGSMTRLLLVGHEPNMGFLLAGLLGEGMARPFKKAGVACLTGGFQTGKMKLEWHFTPKDILGE